MPQPYLRLGLTGYPLSHSLSPVIHTAALQAAGLAGEYGLYPAPPLPEGQAELERLVNLLRVGELDGLNVTIPHKQAFLPLVDYLTPAARAIGAVNTLYRRGGEVCGENTDAPGFLADLYRLAPDLARPPTFSTQEGAGVPRRALVLGAGGSARGVVYALLSANWEVVVAARRLEQAQALVDQLERLGVQPALLHPASLSADHLAEILAGLDGAIDLLVNTTPLGMARGTDQQGEDEGRLHRQGADTSPSRPGSAWPPGLAFPEKAVVYDLVYNPPQTELLRAARQSGLRAFNGLGMLVEQAALAFEIWSGQAAPRQAMYQAVKYDRASSAHERYSGTN